MHLKKRPDSSEITPYHEPRQGKEDVKDAVSYFTFQLLSIVGLYAIAEENENIFGIKLYIFSAFGLIMLPLFIFSTVHMLRLIMFKKDAEGR